MSQSPELALLFNTKDSPALISTGYAKIGQYIAPRLIQAGYDLRMHCPVGHIQGTVEWVEPTTGVKLEIWSGGSGMYGEDIIPLHLETLRRESGGKTSALLFCGDVVALNNIPQWSKNREIVAAAWGAVDWEYPTPKHALDRFQSFLYSFPMSRHGYKVLQQDGLGPDCLLPQVWFGVNPEIWRPQARDEKTMREMRYKETGFNVFSCFANQYQRKGEFEMFAAVREFNRRHPEAKIHFYAMTQVKREWDLAALVDHLGMRDIVTLSDDYRHMMGRYAEEDVARMMAQSDCVMSMGYEGFGMQTVEAQCLSKPVIGFDAAATPELLEDRGLLVPPEKEVMIPPMMRRMLPSTEGVLKALEFVYEHRNDSEAQKHWNRGRDWVLNNCTWDHSAKNLVDRLRVLEQRIVDEEIVGPPGPGEEAVRRSRNVIEVEPR